jgi:hypothetical protein
MTEFTDHDQRGFYYITSFDHMLKEYQFFYHGSVDQNNHSLVTSREMLKPCLA